MPKDLNFESNGIAGAFLMSWVDNFLIVRLSSLPEYDWVR